MVRALLIRLRQSWGHAGTVLLAQLPVVAFISIQPLVLRVLVDDAIVHAKTGLAVSLILTMFILLAANALGDLASQRAAARLGAKVIGELRLELFKHLQELPVDFYTRSKPGDLVSRFTSDLDAIESFLAAEVPALIYYALTLLVGAAILFAMDWRLALLSVVLIPAVNIAPRAIGPRAERANDLRQQDAARVASTLQENVDGQLVVRTFGLQEVTRARFRDEVAGLTESSVRAGLLNGLLGATISATGYALLVLTMAVGTLMATRHELSVGSLVAIFELLWFMIASVQQFSSVVPPFQRAAAGMRRIEELLAEAPREIDASAGELPPFRQAIRCDDVSFAYDGAEPVLKGVNLTIPAGQSAAIVGPSGCGKSTLLGLLMRFHDPTSGVVRFDEHDLREVSRASLRAQLGAVLQDTFLFDTTVRDNIRIGRLGSSDEEVEQATKAVEIHDFILTLPQGYGTKVGQRGARLSGGQRQRIALARAVLRKPTILLLDEATSALDAHTEAAVDGALARLRRGSTVIMVTHRLRLVANYDLIIVLERGEVREQGTHQQLMALGGSYHRMWQLQTGFDMSADGRLVRVEPTRLRAIPLFERLTDAQLAVLADRFVTEQYDADETIFNQGDEGLKFYLLVRGTVEVLKEGKEVEVRRLAVLQDGDFFGEIALLTSARRMASARTRTPCTLLSLDRDQFFGLRSIVPELGALVEQVAMDRLAANSAASHEGI